VATFDTSGFDQPGVGFDQGVIYLRRGQIPNKNIQLGDPTVDWPGYVIQDAELPPPRARATPDLLTAFIPGATVAAAVAPTPYYDTSLPPVRARASPDLLTTSLPGARGIPPGQVIEASLPVARAKASADLLTASLPGSQGIPPGQVVDALLPPLGRGPTIDLRTAFVPGLHGLNPGFVQSAELPPVRARPSADLLTWTVTGQTTVALVAPVPAYDTSLPLVRARASPDALTAFIPGSFGIPPGSVVDALLPPLSRAPTIDLRTSFVSGLQGPGQGSQSAELPLVRARPSADLFSWVVTGQVTVAPVAPTPAYDTSLPPSGRPRSVDLLSWTVTGRVTVQLTPVAGPIDASLPPTGVNRWTLPVMEANASVPGAHGVGPVTGVIPHHLKFRADVGSLMTS